MKALARYFRLTVVGGIVFLVPVVILVLLGAKAMQLASLIARPVTAFLPVSSFAHVVLADLVAVLVLVLVCFVAGLLARASFASELLRKAESRLLWKVPGYGLIKGLLDGLTGSNSVGSMRPVLVRLDDVSQVGFETDRLADGRVVVFVPDAPNPASGCILLLDPDRIEPLPVTVRVALQHFRTMGTGTAQWLGAKGAE